MVSLANPLGGSMRPPPTPPSSRLRPTLGMKRDSSFLDTDDEANLSQTTKRLKVAFADKVDVRIMDDWNDKSFDLVQEEVRMAIERHLAPPSRRDDTAYAKLLQILGKDTWSGEAPSTKLLRKYIGALASRISSLGECGQLVMTILDVTWLGRDERFVQTYTHFFLLLASANLKYVSPIMDRLVANLESLPASAGRLSGEAPMSRADMYNRLHNAIRMMLQRIPSSGTVLLRTLRHQFPNDISTSRAHLRYTKHLLRLADELPAFNAEILALIAERVVHLDVQIQHELDDQELDEDDILMQQRRSLQEQDGAEAEDSDESDDDSVSESEMTMEEDLQRLKDVRLKVAKMDRTQDLLFAYYSPLFRAETPPATHAAYQQLLSHFDSFIAPNRTRHAQFLLFHFAQTAPAYAQHFTQRCIDTVNNRDATATRRLTACAYLASFIARGAHVQRELVQNIFRWLCGYLEVVRKVWEPACAGPDRRSYALYYAVAQALLYIFCFRWRDLVEESDPNSSDMQHEEDILAEGRDLRWIPSVKETLTRNVHSPLNPLKVCSPAIVAEFAGISNHLRFIYVFSLLERNKRIRLGQGAVRVLAAQQDAGGLDLGRRETAVDRKVGEAHHRLEAYFPFDPYLLPWSKRWLEGEYVEWGLPRGMRGDESEEESEGEEEEEEEEEEVGDEEEESEHESVEAEEMLQSGTLSQPISVRS